MKVARYETCHFFVHLFGSLKYPSFLENILLLFLLLKRGVKKLGFD